MESRREQPCRGVLRLRLCCDGIASHQWRHVLRYRSFAVPSDIAADEAMLVDLAEDFAERRISRTAFHAASDRVQVRLDAARARLATQSRPDALSGIDDLTAEWQRLSLERQRAVIAAVLAEITVGPAAGPRNRFDPNRVSLRWRA
jgi:site-specific DNA recombinase